jgi:orotidine-5'-phosphate decarboxylase
MKKLSNTPAKSVTGPRIIVALDFDNLDNLDRLIRQLDPSLCRLKVGKELFTGFGPPVVERLVRLGFDVFLDLKFHDIPNTTAQAVKAAARLGVWMVNVHASGGRAMMSRCSEVLGSEAHQPLLIAVTILTSLSAPEILEIGYAGSPESMVNHLAILARDSGMDGVVCSAREAPGLRASIGKDFCLVTPGIRPADASADDQARVVTPSDALLAGSDYLVIGRPITKAKDPMAALAAIFNEVEAVSVPRQGT